MIYHKSLSLRNPCVTCQIQKVPMSHVTFTPPVMSLKAHTQILNYEGSTLDLALEYADYSSELADSNADTTEDI